MAAVLKTVLLLSCMGTAGTVMLLIIKPLTVKHFPASWQVGVWLAVCVCMLFPAWKVVPQQRAQEVAERLDVQEKVENIVFSESAAAEEAEDIGYNKKIDVYELAAYVWFGGMCVFFAFAVGSYGLFIIKMKKGSIDLLGSKAFEDVKKELNITRNIRLRISGVSGAPMLVGFVFPVIYVPKGDMEEEREKMIFRHELTHYTRKDLLFKWFSLLVNGVHWFNPFAYMISGNLSRACEVACDMDVTRKMRDEDIRLYMNTILDLAEKV